MRTGKEIERSLAKVIRIFTRLLRSFSSFSINKVYAFCSLVVIVSSSNLADS